MREYWPRYEGSRYGFPTVSTFFSLHNPYYTHTRSGCWRPNGGFMIDLDRPFISPITRTHSPQPSRIVRALMPVHACSPTGCWPVSDSGPCPRWTVPDTIQKGRPISRTTSNPLTWLVWFDALRRSLPCPRSRRSGFRRSRLQLAEPDLGFSRVVALRIGNQLVPYLHRGCLVAASLVRPGSGCQGALLVCVKPGR